MGSEEVVVIMRFVGAGMVVIFLSTGILNFEKNYNQNSRSKSMISCNTSLNVIFIGKTVGRRGW
jgi:hypothetical protein